MASLVPADGLVPLCARSSVATMMAKFGFHRKPPRATERINELDVKVLVCIFSKCHFPGNNITVIYDCYHISLIVKTFPYWTKSK